MKTSSLPKENACQLNFGVFRPRNYLSDKERLSRSRDGEIMRRTFFELQLALATCSVPSFIVNMYTPEHFSSPRKRNITLQTCKFFEPPANIFIPSV